MIWPFHSHAERESPDVVARHEGDGGEHDRASSRGTTSIETVPSDEGDDGSRDSEQALLLGNRQQTQTGLRRYARKSVLKNYIPEIDPDHPRAITLRVKMAKRSTMLNIQLSVAVVVVALNLALLPWLLSAYPLSHHGIGTFAVGNCSRLGMLNSALHVALNIVSSLFLASGNYCMQILVAPSREEIDRAYSKGRSLEIGVPSVKNLWRIRRSRALTWVSIGVFSSLLHLFWNSAIFASHPVVIIPRAVVTSDFPIASENWTVSDPLGDRSWWRYAPGFGEASHNKSWIYNLQNLAPSMERLDPEACIRRCIDPLTATSSVIVVAQNMTSEQFNGSSLLDGWVSGWDGWTMSTAWICNAHQHPDGRKWRGCDLAWAETFANDWQLRWVDIWWIKVGHCLVGDEGNNSERCGFHFSAHIWGIVCGCTLIECALIFFVWFKSRRGAGEARREEESRTLVTMGDAIQSFLRHPGSAEMRQREVGTTPKAGTIALKNIRWRVHKRVPWRRAVSRPLWIISYTCFLEGFAITTAPLMSTVRFLQRVGIDVSFQAIWTQKFNVNPMATTGDLGPLGNSSKPTLTAFLGNILVANSPQLLISTLYLFYNSILTRQLVADEWLGFLRKNGKKPLRVSSPIGMQRSSYFLSLPLKYSTPLLVLTTTLHWLISQSIFLVQTSSYGPGAAGERLPVYDTVMRGYSILGSVLSLILALIAVLALGLNAVMRSYKDVPPGFQRMGYNSSAIRALSQRPRGDDDAHLFPVSLGMVEDKESKDLGCQGRMTFSTDIHLDQEPTPDKVYRMPVLVASGETGLQRATRATILYGATSIAVLKTLIFPRRRGSRKNMPKADYWY